MFLSFFSLQKMEILFLSFSSLQKIQFLFLSFFSFQEIEVMYLRSEVLELTIPSLLRPSAEKQGGGIVSKIFFTARETFFN